MKAVKQVLSVWLVAFSISLLSGCAQGVPGQREQENPPQPALEHEAEPEGEEPSPEVPESAEVQEEDTDSVNAPLALSLARRMCGTYSFRPEPEDEEGVHTMALLSFGDNLYGVCGMAMDEGEEELSPYSFWAAEFLPYEKQELESTEAESVRVRELRFSVMSNFSRYWDEGVSLTLTLKEDGLEVQEYADSAFLHPSGDARLYLRDERVEGAFPYLKENGSEDELSGLWTLSGSEGRVFMAFDAGNLTVYKKTPDSEVFLARGGYSLSDGKLSGRLSTLEGGGMPVEWEADYSVEGEKLILTHSADVVLKELEGRQEFVRAKEEDIPLITAAEAAPDSSAFASSEEEADLTALKEQDYYAVIVSSAKSPEGCSAALDRLEQAGYVQCPVIYTPDFSGLNPEPWYAAASGLYPTKQEAEKALELLKGDGFSEAYVKYAGTFTGEHYSYYSYSTDSIEQLEDKIFFHQVQVEIPYPADTEPLKMDLVVDKETVFAPEAELQFFGNYEQGDTPYEWISKNLRLLEENADEYLANGPALSGVFEVSLEGSRIKAYYGSYWWD